MRAALDAADAGGLVRQALATQGVARVLRGAAAVDVIAVGKAAGPMLVAAVADRTQVAFRRMLGVSTQSPEALPPGAEWHTSAHPVPDQRSVAAARAVIDTAAAGRDQDLLLVLLSGGASALMAQPADGLSLDDKQRTTERLLREGAEIHALNTVRKHLSAIKGGQLAAAAGGSVLTLAVSDVVGDDLSAIGSGPTVPDATTFTDALMALDRYGGRDRYPPDVVARLTAGAGGAIAETPKPDHPRLRRSDARVIGGSRTAVDAARAAAEARGYTVHVLSEPVTGEARVAGPALVDAVSTLLQAATGTGEVVAPPLCLLAFGETTVKVTGAGRGGRNQECVVSMARGLATIGRAVVAASVGTDGVDGPTDAAGGMVDTSTLARAATAGIGSPESYLADNNSFVFLAALGDVIRTGSTNTNVGDLHVILVGRW